MICMRATHVVLPSLTSLLQSSPSPAGGPFNVCPSPFLAEGPSFFCPPHTWFGGVALCVICTLGYAGWAAQLITCVCAREHSGYFLRLWHSRDATTGTPARAWRDRVLCCRVPLAYLVSMMLSPLRFKGDGTSFIVPSPFLARASCRSCDTTLGFAGWAALGAPLHPTCPTCGRCELCLVGVRRGVATTHVWPAIPRLTGPPLRGQVASSG